MGVGFLSSIGYAAEFFVEKFVRIKKNRIVFTSFDGHYSDSPRYISEKIHELSPETELVWLVSDKYRPLVPDYAVAVDIKSKKAKKYLHSARALVDNVYWRKVYFRTGDGLFDKFVAKMFRLFAYRKNQLCFTTWHGTPLKRMGRDQIGNNDRGFVCPNATMILGNKFVLDIMKHITFDAMNMELIGCPRNDILFCASEKREELKRKLGLPERKKIVLYAPTFRTDGGIDNKNIMRSGVNQINEMDFDRLFDTLSRKFGGDFALVCRFHYHVEQTVDFAALEERYPGKIINGNLNDDMAEYLAVTDILVTDASSCMFDFALTGRPCFILFPDLDYYGSRERGFYLDVEKLPFPCSKDFAGMLDDISKFDSERYTREVCSMLDSFEFVDDPHSSERVAKYILERCNKK